MRHFYNVIATLPGVDISNIIYIMEQGLELEKAHYIATKNPDSRKRIADSCVFLSVLHFRQLDINRPGGHISDDPV